MSEDKLSFLDEPVDAPEPVETIEAPEAEPAVEAAPTVQRDEKGRFAPIEGKGEPESAPPAPEPKEPHTAPITALLDEREKRQAAERRAEEYQRKLDELTRRQQPQTQAEMPDVITDPDGYRRALMAEMHQARLADRVQISEVIAQDKYGADLVKEAFEFYNTQPRAVSEAFLQETLPFVAAVEYYKRQKALSEIGPDPEAYRSKIEAEIRSKIEAEARGQGQLAPARPSAPPASLASAPSAGSNAIAPRGNAFDTAFPR